MASQQRPMIIKAKTDPSCFQEWFPFPLHLKSRVNTRSKFDTYVKPDPKTVEEAARFKNVFIKTKLSKKPMRLALEYYSGDIVISPMNPGDGEVIKIRAREVDKVIPVEKDACAVAIHLRGKLEPVVLFCESDRHAQHIMTELIQFTRP
eukprot:JZ551011.1.p1 GENE.JZ551011.1~~JZ551011.1.p1  ORF type:complete len:149 (+),score=28.33 JZ551011.1:77-523(+)